MGDLLISMNDVSKRFGKKQILTDVNLKIENGQSIALLGHNGSGKSTLLRMIGGLTVITSGKISYQKELKFSYIPEHFPKMNITAKQYMKHMGLIEGVPERVLEEKSEELFRIFYMDTMIDIPMKHLSKGTLQKVAVIQALLSKPDVLLLDEPLSGQDTRSQKNFIKLINQLHQQGVTIIMSCHEMFLVNQISHTAFEIRDQRLEPVQLYAALESTYDILFFEKNSNHAGVNDAVLQMVDRIDENQDSVKLIVQRDRSNRIIIQMLKDGFQLRAMKGVEE